MKTAKYLVLGTVSLASFFAFNGCSKDEGSVSDPGDNTVTLVKRFEIPLNASYQTGASTGRTETGNAILELMSDNSLRYSINVPTVTGGDSLSMAQLYAGDVVTSGPAVLDLQPMFASGIAADTITGLRQSLADSIESGAIYLNVLSRDAPEGLVRGQLDKTIDFASNVDLNGAGVVPAVTTTATGNGVFRLTSDKVLYSNLNVGNLEAGDSVSTAGLYLGSADANGTLLKQFADSYADFGITKTDTLTDAEITQLKNDPLYVTAASKNQANGLVRGQIR